jgi:multiple sugar transport system permease protein
MSFLWIAIVTVWAVFGIALLVRGLAWGKWRAFSHALAYHILIVGALVMVLPFAWMLSTSLKDFQSANQTPPSWMPTGVRYFASSPDGKGEIEVGIIQEDTPQPWETLQTLDKVTVAPIKDLNRETSHFEVSGMALRRERSPRWENYVEAWNSPAKGNPEAPVTFARYFWVSGVSTILTTLGTLLTSVLAAYAFAKMRFRGSGLLFYIVLATMMIPGQVLLIPNFLILSELPRFTFGLQWLDNYPSLIAPWLASVFAIFLLRQFFMGIPDELWEAAQLDGAGRWSYLWRIMVPMSVPALITAGLFVFLGEWNSLIWPLIVTTSPNMRTLMVGLQTLNDEMGNEYQILMAASTMAIAPILVAFFFLQRFFVEGVARVGIR